MTLQALLKPCSIAIVGASAVPTRIGGIPLKLLMDAGFKKIYPINPKYPEIAGLRCYPDIESITDPVDLVLLAIAAEEVLACLERCHAVGVKAAIVFAAGFAETNKAEGTERQAALASSRHLAPPFPPASPPATRLCSRRAATCARPSTVRRVGPA
jgi:acyl-CoA synthetase (NDP forming)